ncbi:hypothetical protein N9E02_00775 [Ilumatobacteraceae bacterium]|jgi:hypothetical protein|nr:hypothetical protein [Ilumatobacteraceae bacterium]
MPSLPSIAAEVDALAELISRSRDRLVALTEPLNSSDHEDVLASMYEAERLLRASERALVRAGRTIR